MEERFANSHEVVGRLIRHAHQSKDAAEQLYQQIVVEQRRTFQLPDGEVKLSQTQRDEFVERFSSEVGPEIWVSKSGKY